MQKRTFGAGCELLYRKLMSKPNPHVTNFNSRTELSLKMSFKLQFDLAEAEKYILVTTLTYM